jgi:hypothetical protein
MHVSVTFVSSVILVGLSVVYLAKPKTTALLMMLESTKAVA